MVTEMSNDRIKHSIKVADTMSKLAAENCERLNIDPDDAFICGCLHDIGYCYTDNHSEHNHVGGEILKKLGFKFWEAVYNHGDPDVEFNDNMLILLDYADMICGPAGEDLTMDARAEEIRQRYGESSTVYERVKRLCDKIQVEKARLHIT